MRYPCRRVWVLTKHRRGSSTPGRAASSSLDNIINASPRNALNLVYFLSCFQSRCPPYSAEQHIYRHCRHAGLRLLQPQPQCSSARARRALAQGDEHWHHNRGLPVQWRRGHSCRHAGDERPHRGRQGTFTPPFVRPGEQRLTGHARTARSSTTSRLRSGAPAPAPPPTPSSRPRSFRPTSSYTPCRRGASRAW